MANASFWKGASCERFKSLVLAQRPCAGSNTVLYRGKITYHPLCISFFHKLISVQKLVGMFHLNVAKSTAVITLSSCTSYEFSPTNDKNAELNRQFTYGMALIKTKHYQ